LPGDMAGWGMAVPPNKYLAHSLFYTCTPTMHEPAWEPFASEYFSISWFALRFHLTAIKVWI
jgi:hypothetical protein